MVTALCFSGHKSLCVYQQSALVSKPESRQIPVSVFSFRKGELPAVAQVLVQMVSAHGMTPHRQRQWSLHHSCIAKRCRNPWAKPTEAALNWLEAVLLEISCTHVEVQLWADMAKLPLEPGWHLWAAPHKQTHWQTLISLKWHCTEQYR